MKRGRAVAGGLCGVVAASAVLTWGTLWSAPAGAQSVGGRTLTAAQQQLVAEKDQARRAAGVPSLQDAGARFAGPGTPHQDVTRTLKTSKADMLARWQKEADYVASVEAALRQVGRDPAEALPLRQQLEARRKKIEALPDGPLEFPVEGNKAGGQSITWSDYTYSSAAAVDPGERKDPTNMIFYQVGTAWDVQYDLRNWALGGKRWQLTCGGSQWVVIWDAQHTGGRDDVRQDEYQLEPEESINTCPGYDKPAVPLRDRYHVRLFGSFVQDSHTDGFGWWSTADGHHDPVGHLCGDQFNQGREEVTKAFVDGVGNPMWFVGSIWYVLYDNGGTQGGGCPGATFDGYTVFIQLTS